MGQASQNSHQKLDHLGLWLMRAGLLMQGYRHHGLNQPKMLSVRAKKYQERMFCVARFSSDFTDGGSSLNEMEIRLEDNACLSIGKVRISDCFLRSDC